MFGIGAVNLQKREQMQHNHEVARDFFGTDRAALEHLVSINEQKDSIDVIPDESYGNFLSTYNSKGLSKVIMKPKEISNAYVAWEEVDKYGNGGTFKVSLNLVKDGSISEVCAGFFNNEKNIGDARDVSAKYCKAIMDYLAHNCAEVNENLSSNKHSVEQKLNDISLDFYAKILNLYTQKNTDRSERTNALFE